MTNTSASTRPSRFAKAAMGVRRGLPIGAVVLGIMTTLHPGSLTVGDVPPSHESTSTPSNSSSPRIQLADFGTHRVSPDARYLAHWTAASGDHLGMQFVIVDKNAARVHVFDPASRLIASSPVLLGSARGDDSVPDIGSRPIADVRPEERTTPAGRFIAERGRNLSGEDVIWVDYDNAVSMHRVRTTNPMERRLQRLATPTIDDNRISYGCINVPIAFYEAYIRPIFANHRAVVYVLPEVKTVQQVFAAYGLTAPHRLAAKQ